MFEKEVQSDNLKLFSKMSISENNNSNLSNNHYYYNYYYHCYSVHVSHQFLYPVPVSFVLVPAHISSSMYQY